MAKSIAKNKLALAFIVLLAAGLSVAALNVYSKNQASPGFPNRQAEEEAKSSTASTQSTDDGEDKQKTLNQSQQENQAAATAQADFSLTLVRAGQSSAGQAIEIRALVSGASEGTCSVTFSGPGRSFTKTSSIMFDGRTTSCGALDAAAAEFSQSGTWIYQLKATSGSKASNTIQERVSVQK